MAALSGLSLITYGPTSNVWAHRTADTLGDVKETGYFAGQKMRENDVVYLAYGVGTDNSGNTVLSIGPDGATASDMIETGNASTTAIANEALANAASAQAGADGSVKIAGGVLDATLLKPSDGYTPMTAAAYLTQGKLYPEFYRKSTDTDYTNAFNLALAASASSGRPIWLSRKVYDINAIFVPPGASIEGIPMDYGQVTNGALLNMGSVIRIGNLDQYGGMRPQNGASIRNVAVVSKAIDYTIAAQTYTDAVGAALEAQIAAFTGTAIRMMGHNCTVENVLICGFARGLYSGDQYSRHYINKIYGDNLTGIEITANKDCTRITNCHMWNFYVGNAYNASVSAGATRNALCERSGYGYYIHDDYDMGFMSNCFAFGYSKNFWIDDVWGAMFESLASDTLENSTTQNIGFHISGAIGQTLFGNMVGSSGYDGLLIETTNTTPLMFRSYTYGTARNSHIKVNTTVTPITFMLATCTGNNGGAAHIQVPVVPKELYFKRLHIDSGGTYADFQWVSDTAKAATSAARYTVSGGIANTLGTDTHTIARAAVQTAGGNSSATLITATAGTAAITAAKHAARIVMLEDFLGVGDGTTSDAAAWVAAQAALGTTGGTIKLDPAKAYYVPSQTLADNIMVDGGGRTAGQPRGSTTAYNFNSHGARLLVDGGNRITAVTSADAPAGQTYLRLTTWSTNFIVGGQIFGPAGVVEGTTLTGTSTANNQWNLSIPLGAAVPAGTTVTLSNLGFSIGNCSGMRGVVVMRKGIVSPPTSYTTAQTEIDTWANQGTGIYMQGYDSSLENCMVMGFRTPVIVPRFARQKIKDVRVDGMNGMLFGATGDFPYISDNHIWPFYTANIAGVSDYATTDASASGGSTQCPATATDVLKAMTLYRPGIAIGAMYNTSDLKIFRCFVFGSQTDFLIRASNDVSFIACYADNLISLTTPDPVNNSGAAHVTTYGFKTQGTCRNPSFPLCQQASNSYGWWLEHSSGTTQEQNFADLSGCTSNQAALWHVVAVSGGVAWRIFRAYGGGVWAKGGGVYAPAAGAVSTNTMPCKHLDDDGFKFVQPASTAVPYSIDSTVLPYFRKQATFLSGLTDTYGTRLLLPTTAPASGGMYSNSGVVTVA